MSCLLLLVVLVVLLLALTVAGVYIIGTRSKPGRMDALLGRNAFACLELNLDSAGPGMRGLLHQVEDSIVRPKVETSLSRGFGFLAASSLGRTLARTTGIFQNWIAPALIPHRVSSVYVLSDDRTQFGTVLALDARLSFSWLRAANSIGRFLPWPVQSSARSVRVNGRDYPAFDLNHRYLVPVGKWLLIADSLHALRSTLDALRPDQASGGKRQALSVMRQQLADTNDLMLLLDNQDHPLRLLLTRLEAKLLATARPADKELLEYLFERASSLSDQVSSIEARASLLTPDSAQARMDFALRSRTAASGLAAFLNFLKRFPMPEFEATRREPTQLDLNYEASAQEQHVIVRARIRGTRGLVIRYLRQALD
jgi:hypothetical protein